ncbi:ABC transporter permease [Parabacteroides sp. Marseille-P3160]|uniref:ABC transporter permease n=1 Tax=Parabacteroides sp. Marseille-P3160 TaxID=1917887 RepID=UPI0009B9D7C2|nr:ABC transporter permease [Parabacteroides sp. Marseille-P3160]
MKTIIRNFFSVLRRFKLATVLNLLGLSVAFAAFMIILMQVDYDRDFDRFHKDADCIYRVEFGYEGSYQAVISRPFADAFTKSSPHIKAGAILNPFSNDLFFSVERQGTKFNYRELYRQMTPSVIDIFDFKMEGGTAKSLEEPKTVLIPASLSQKLFGTEPAVGKLLMLEKGNLKVGGVYTDFPINSSIENTIIESIDPKENVQNWGNWNYHFFIKTDSGALPAELIANFKKNFDPKQLLGEKGSWEISDTGPRLTPLTELHYTTDVTYDGTPKSSRQTVAVLFAISIIILIIGGINFTNFTMALTPMRIKSINTQKVLGSADSTLRLALLGEAVAISVVAYLFSLGIVYFSSLSPIAGLVDADISLSAHPFLAGATGVLSLFVGFLAGLYPSYYITSFQPALVLKGSFGLTPKGKQMRNTLIGIQFFASFALIIGALFMYLQNHYMQHTSLGYDKDALVITDLNSKVLKSKDAFSNQLKSFSGIDGVTYGEQLLSSADQYMGWGRRYRDKDINFQCLPVDPNFLTVLGIPVIEGRNFREEDKLSRQGAFIFNETAKKKYELVVGESIDSMLIAGVMPDVKFASFRTEVTPMAFYVWGTQNWGSQPHYAYIRVKAGSDLYAAMAHVKATLTTIDPEYTFLVRFYDEVLNNTYVKEGKLTSQITLFSLVAIFISIVGVFGLVVFESQYRRKEIGIRKVLGSTTRQILLMFCKRYLVILMICFVIAAPVAYYAVRRWLESFAYKTPLYAWVFVLAFLLVALITVATVSFQSWRTANENPVNSIKTE